MKVIPGARTANTIRRMAAAGISASTSFANLSVILRRNVQLSAGSENHAAVKSAHHGTIGRM